jgi:hypothetical protein
MKHLILLMILMIAGCSATKVVEVPIPIDCPKPSIQAPHDYMADLNDRSSASAFVRACLATRESCFNAYKSCAYYMH